MISPKERFTKAKMHQLFNKSKQDVRRRLVWSVVISHRKYLPQTFMNSNNGQQAINIKQTDILIGRLQPLFRFFSFFFKKSFTQLNL